MQYPFKLKKYTGTKIQIILRVALAFMIEQAALWHFFWDHDPFLFHEKELCWCHNYPYFSQYTVYLTMVKNTFFQQYLPHANSLGS